MSDQVWRIAELAVDLYGHLTFFYGEKEGSSSVRSVHEYKVNSKLIGIG